jgi:hypothetical protein
MVASAHRPTTRSRSSALLAPSLRAIDAAYNDVWQLLMDGLCVAKKSNPTVGTE